MIFFNDALKVLSDEKHAAGWAVLSIGLLNLKQDTVWQLAGGSLLLFTKQ